MGAHLYTNGAWTDSGKIYRNSLNLFDLSTWENATATRGSVIVDNGTVTITATENDCYTNTYGNATYDISVIPGETYTLIWDLDYLSAGILYFFSGTTVANSVLLSISSATKIKSFTIPEGHTKFAFRLSVATAGRTIEYSKIMLYKGEQEMTYEPYNVVDWYTNHGHSYSYGAWS